MAGDVKRLLAVSWCMPPLVYPRSIQVSRLVAEMARNGWQITVLALDPRSAGADVLIDRDLEREYAGCYQCIPIAPSARPSYGWKHTRSIAPGQMQAVGGNCYSVALPESQQYLFWIPGDSSRNPFISRTVLFEDGVPLGPAHADHTQIRNVGRGSFSHWSDFVYFSTSDNSDPRANGRQYQLEYRAVPAFRRKGIEARERALGLSNEMLWLQPAVKAARPLLQANCYSALVTFAQPWVDHLVGLELSRRLAIPWIAHFSDPWVDSGYYAKLDREILESWRQMERQVVERADAIVFTNSQARDLVMDKYPHAWLEKTHSIPHSYDPGLLKTSAGGGARHEQLHLVYTGNVFAERSPMALLRALEILSHRIPLGQELRVSFVGGGSGFQQQAIELGLGDWVTFHGPAPYIASLEAAAAADVLLIIDAPSATPSPFLPSKIVDYIMFRKPILALTPEQGATADLVRELGCPIVAPDDAPAIANAIERLRADWKAGTLGVSPQYEQVAARYAVRQTAAEFEDIIASAQAHYNPRARYNLGGNWWSRWR